MHKYFKLQDVVDKVSKEDKRIKDYAKFLDYYGNILLWILMITEKQNFREYEKLLRNSIFFLNFLKNIYFFYFRCPRSLLYISYYIKWARASWTYSMKHSSHDVHEKRLDKMVLVKGLRTDKTYSSFCATIDL